MGETVATMSTSTSGADDRVETIARPEASRAIVLVPGAELRPMAGAHLGARGLFTGLLTLGPGASIPYHARPASEAMVLLEGDAAVDVEDRRYRLGPLDAVAVMPRRPQRVANLSADRPAVFHVALALDAPEQNWINGRFAPVEQPPDSPGREGSERVVRRVGRAGHRARPARDVPGPLQRRARHPRHLRRIWSLRARPRLPCHRHEFDESITIVQGTATCVVEGRRHELSGLATAMVPKGRCHYFINLTLEPMAMVWVYAGDMPDRIVMDEHFCHPEKGRGPK